MGLFDIIGQLIGLKSTPNQKLDLSQSAASAGLPIIYGHRKVEAITVLKRVSEHNAPQAQNSVDDYVYRGDQDRDSKRNYKNWLHRIDVWGQGPIEDIVRFWIDDDPHTHNRFGSKRPYFRAASMFGAETQTALTALKTAVPEWSNAHKGNGVAYSWSRFFNSTQFPQFRGEPKLEAEIKGVRLYDPRKDTSLGGTGSHDYDDPSTWQYGNNRALTLLNYLMGPYGLNAPKGEVDLESFIVAADICDQDLPIPPPRTNDTDNPVDVPDPNTGDTVTVQPGQPYPQYRPYQAGDTQKRFVTDAVIDPQQDVVGNVKSLLEEFGWSLSWSNGKHKLVLEIEDILPVATFDANTILGGWSIERGNRADRYNRITVRFKNQNRHFSEDTVSWPPLDSVIYNGTGEPDDNGYLDQDGGRALHTDITLATVTDYYRAQRVAELKVEKSRIGERIKGLQLAPEAMLLEPGDVIALNYPEKDYVTTGDPQTDDLFIVENIQVSSTLDVSVDLTRYDSRIYPLTNTDQEPLLPPGSGFNPFDEPGAVTNLNAIEYHTNKADGSVISGIYLTWDTTISAIPVERVEVKWRDIADAELAATDDYAGTISLPPEATACRIPDLVDNRQYRVVVSYKTRLSQRSIEAVLDVDLSATVVSKLSNIEEGATDGAVIGTNLYDHDGFLIDAGDVVTADGQLTMGTLWDFQWSPLGWTSNNMIVDGVLQGIHVTPNNTDGQLLSPDNLNIDGSKYDKVAVRMKRVVKGAGDFFEFPVMFYKTDSHGFSINYRRTRSLRFGDQNARTFVFDMANLTDGDDDWVTSTIKQIRFDPSVTTGDTFEIDWIGVGRVSAPAQDSVAANLADEIQFADIGAADNSNYEVFGKVNLEDTSLKVGDQVSVGCEILALDDRRGKLEVIFEEGDTTDIKAYTSPYVAADTDVYQRAVIEGLIIPPGTEMIRYRLLREVGLSGAVGGRRPSLNKGPRALDWYPVRQDVEPGADVTRYNDSRVSNAAQTLENLGAGAVASLDTLSYTYLEPGSANGVYQQPYSIGSYIIGNTQELFIQGVPSIGAGVNFGHHSYIVDYAGRGGGTLKIQVHRHYDAQALVDGHGTELFNSDIYYSNEPTTFFVRGKDDYSYVGTLYYRLTVTPIGGIKYFSMPGFLIDFWEPRR